MFETVLYANATVNVLDDVHQHKREIGSEKMVYGTKEKKIEHL